MPKVKSKSKTKKALKDTPPAERYAGVIAEDYDAKLDRILENMGTIENRLGRNLNSFKLEVMQGFAKVDLRFMAVDQRFDKVDQRFDKVEKELTNTRTELKAEIQGVKTELETKIEDVRTELKTDIKSVETRLSDKIDSFGNRLETVERKTHNLKQTAAH